MGKFILKMENKRGFFRNILHKIKFGWRVIRVYKTWIIGFLDYFGLLGKNKIILHKLRNKTKYIIRTKTNDFGIINEVYIVNEYNKLLPYITKKPKTAPVIIDIGAQMGVFSIFSSIISKKYGKESKVYAFEPFKDNFKMLQKNIELNKLDNIQSFELGVAGKSGKRQLVVSKENTGGHSLYENHGEKIEIKTITLKQVFEDNKIKECDFLKLDCEGAEYEILFSTPQEILKKIKSITAEYHEVDDKMNINRLREFLEKSGFEVIVEKNVGTGMLYAWR